MKAYEVSIQHLLLFILASGIEELIECVSFNTTLVIVHLLQKSVRLSSLSSFNTTLVIVHLIKVNLKHTLLIMFQYNTCYCSSNIRHLAHIDGFVSIQHLLLFISRWEKRPNGRLKVSIQHLLLFI